MSCCSLLSLGCSCIAGFGTWVVLNRREVRGDHAFLAFATCFITLYLGVHLHSSLSVREDLWKTFQLLATYASALILSTLCYRLSPYHPLAAFPGPILWRISTLRLVISSFHGYRHVTLDLLHKKYGKFVRIGPNHLSINSSSAAGILYSSPVMDKGPSYNSPGHVPGVSLFFKHTREEHAARKRIWSAGFTANAFTQYCYPMDRRVWELTQCLQERSASRGVVDLADALAHWSYDFMGEMVFGGCNDLELMKDGDKENLVGGGKMAMAIVDSFGQAPWLLDILWHLPASQDVHQLRRAAQRMMQNRVKQSKNVDIQDVSSYLLAGDPASGDHIPDTELEIDALVAVQAGSDNTATLLGMAFYYILADRRIYRKLQQELDAHFSDPKDTLELDKLAELPYLNAVVNEALRIGTPFFLPRVVPDEGINVDGIRIPKGSIVALAAYSQQISEDNFGPDALVFRPERWLEDDGTGLNKSAMFSFTSGRFVCIAKTFALHELRFVLGRLILNLELNLAPGFDVDQFRRGIRNLRTTVFDYPLMVEVKPRAVKV
ncbi:cytochrome P450 [Lyophyllum atratum]|nr:cytochrome P450 [Lyophyllum atratum]